MDEQNKRVRKYRKNRAYFSLKNTINNLKIPLERHNRIIKQIKNKLI